MALREINADTLVSTLTRRGRQYRDRLLVTLRRNKEGYFSDKPMQDQWGQGDIKLLLQPFNYYST